jgi:hypothetical protein
MPKKKSDNNWQIDNVGGKRDNRRAWSGSQKIPKKAKPPKGPKLVGPQSIESGGKGCAVTAVTVGVGVVGAIGVLKGWT